MKRLIATAGLAAWASPAAAAVTLFLVDPSSVTTSPVVTSPESFTISGPLSWSGAGMFEGAFSAADIDQTDAQFGINAGDSFKIWTVSFDGAGPWSIAGTFARGTVPIWDFNNPVVGGGGGQSNGGGGGSNLGDPPPTPGGDIGGSGPGVASSVPEPSTWVMMALGFGLMWFGAQKARKARLA